MRLVALLLMLFSHSSFAYEEQFVVPSIDSEMNEAKWSAPEFSVAVDVNCDEAEGLSLETVKENCKLDLFNNTWGSLPLGHKKVVYLNNIELNTILWDRLTNEMLGNTDDATLDVYLFKPNPNRLSFGVDTGDAENKGIIDSAKLQNFRPSVESILSTTAQKRVTENTNNMVEKVLLALLIIAVLLISYFYLPKLFRKFIQGTKTAIASINNASLKRYERKECIKASVKSSATSNTNNEARKAIESQIVKALEDGNIPLAKALTESLNDLHTK
ncbi:hypothetical protein ACSMYB_24320 [Vibrio parahaemolyticus]|uniref:hypothetical protein n=1 Tax=Vibrio parahaemolyticus TaxID=670 RepID=UPI003F1A1D28